MRATFRNIALTRGYYSIVDTGNEDRLFIAPGRPDTLDPELADLDHVRVIGSTEFQRRNERGQRRSDTEPIQMGGTPAIGSTEAEWRCPSAQFLSQHFRPQAFASKRIVAEPNRFERSVPPQIVDVPMRPNHRSAMVG